VRICLLADSYVRVTETFVYEPVQWLGAAGHRVDVLARRVRALPGAARGVAPTRVLGARAGGAALAGALLRAPFRTALGALRCWPLRRERGFRVATGVRWSLHPEVREADVLFAHFGPLGARGVSTAFLAERPYAVYFHGYDVGRVLRESPRAYDALFRSGVGLLTNSEYLRGRLIAAGAPPGNVAVVPLGVDPKVTACARDVADPPRVVTVARLVPKKGVADSLRAFAALRRSASEEWRYDLVGDGPLRGELGRVAREERIADRVSFHGFLSREETLEALRAASIFLLASRLCETGSTEGTPVALLEAATLGIPVVATRHGGIPEVLPPEAASEGFLVEEGDTAALGAALLRLARAPALREEWGRACADHVRKRHSADAHVGALTEALRRHARVPRFEPVGGGTRGERAVRTAPPRARQRLRLAVVANEFFDRGVGRMGGFGWAAAQVARCFRDAPHLGVEVVFLTGELRARDGAAETRVHGAPLLLRTPDYRERIRRLSPDLLLLIDYRNGYRAALGAVPTVPFILWSRDPRDSADWAEVGTLRMPGPADGAPDSPCGPARVDCTSFRKVARSARWRRRPWLLATTTPYLGAKVADTYGVAPARVFDLPNPLAALPPPPASRAARPTVLFLGRLEAIKRPWVFVEVARRMPQVDFVMLGDVWARGTQRWEPRDLPPNARLAGHLEGEEKAAALARAWLLVGTSIHEGLAISYLEALAAGLPLVACQDPEGVVSRFGSYVGRFDGSGLDSVPAFVNAIGALLADDERRERLGREGREWVAAHHSRERFLGAFRELTAELGVRWSGD
jgi:glycosyltransferase involved in cell wall biosynthesis